MTRRRAAYAKGLTPSLALNVGSQRDARGRKGPRGLVVEPMQRPIRDPLTAFRATTQTTQKKSPRFRGDVV
jgi:hypothetical protein